jgi:hypothetical protein
MQTFVEKFGTKYEKAVTCGTACKTDPHLGVIGVQK